MDNIHDLLPFYALDVLTQEERIAVEAYLKNNPAARVELAELHETTERLIQTIEPQTPSPQVKANLMARVAKSVEPAPVVATPVREPVLRWWQKPLFQRAIPAVGMAFAAVAFIWAFTLLGSVNDTKAQLTALEESTSAQLVSFQATTTVLEAELSDLRVQNQTLAQALEQEAGLIKTLTSLDSQQLTFGSADSAHGLLTVNKSAETALLSVGGLDSLGESETYQLWLIGDAGASSAGIFSVDETGEGNLLIRSDSLQSFATLGISIEPAGGSEAPTNVIFAEDL